MFLEKVFYSENRRGQYLNYLYRNEGTAEKLPLVIYIHGAGSRGNTLSEMAPVGPIGEIQKGRKINAVIVAPQCHCDTWFELYDVLLEFIDSMRSAENVDKSRVYLCGSSMGGYTCWQLAMSRPDWFAALVPVCGGGMYWNAERLKNLPIWAFHGALDRTVLPEETLHMVRAVNLKGGNAKITVFPHAAHNSWEDAFSLDELWDWMFAQKNDRAD